MAHSRAACPEPFHNKLQDGNRGTKGQEVSSGVSGGLPLEAAIDYSTYTQLVRTQSLASPQKQEKMENVVFTP